MKNKINHIKFMGISIKLNWLTLTFIFWIKVSLSFSQTVISFVDQSNPRVNKYAINERVSVELDRDYYLAGETLYFSCLTYDPILKVKTELSKIVYAEFFNNDNKTIEQIKIEMEQGIGCGNIEIPKNLQSGIYYFRAYTNYMKNEGCSSFYMQSVIVFNPFDRNSEYRMTNSAGKPHVISIHAEAGNFVYNTWNRAVCYTTDAANKPVSAQVKLIDQNNSTITQFNTNEFGLGDFSFTPKPYMNYRIELMDQQKLVDFPLHIDKQSIGITNLSQLNDSIYLKIKSFDYPQFPLLLTVVKSKALIKLKVLNPNDSVVKIPLSWVPNGWVQFQLCDTGENVVAFRNTLIKPIEETILKIETSQLVFKCRQPIKLSLLSNANKLVSVSVSLSDSESISKLCVQPNNAVFTSELYPHLEKLKIPLSLLLTDSMGITKVLMIQDSVEKTSRNYECANDSKPTYLPEIKGDIISGYLSNTENKPIINATVNQTFINSVAQLNTIKTKNDGSFYFYANQPSAKSELVLFHNEGENANIIYQDEFYSNFLYIEKERIDFALFNKEKLNKQFLNLQINDSYSEILKKDSVIQNQQESFYGKPDRVFFIKEYISLVSLNEFIFEVIPWVFPYQKENKRGVKIFYKGTDTEIGENPLFLLDGIPVDDQESLLNLRCKDLLSVSVVYDKYFYQNNYFDGILDIKTINGDGKLIKLPSNCTKYTFVGVQPTVKNSIVSHSTTSTLPFFKNQLYWESAISLSENKLWTGSFIAPDNPGLFLIKCTVLNTDGSKKSFYSSFEVVHGN
jgi:hypothetical protein